jgi:hypothetical protein
MDVGLTAVDVAIATSGHNAITKAVRVARYEVIARIERGGLNMKTEKEEPR